MPINRYSSSVSDHYDSSDEYDNYSEQNYEYVYKTRLVPFNPQVLISKSGREWKFKNSQL